MAPPPHESLLHRAQPLPGFTLASAGSAAGGLRPYDFLLHAAELLVHSSSVGGMRAPFGERHSIKQPIAAQLPREGRRRRLRIIAERGAVPGARQTQAPALVMDVVQEPHLDKHVGVRTFERVLLPQSVRLMCRRRSAHNAPLMRNCRAVQRVIHRRTRRARVAISAAHPAL